MTPALERLSSLPALLAATRRASAGRRHQADVAAFCMDAESRCLELSRALRLPADHAEAWRPARGRLVQIRDPKPRWITIVPFADRVVHHALMAEVEPALERYAIADTFACRLGKGQHQAVVRARAFCRRHPWVLKADISRYFASIPRDRLLAHLRRRRLDPEVWALLARVIGDPSACGLPVGSLCSQHLANFYLGALDHHLKDQLGRKGYVRYMDDFLVFGAHAELLAMRAWLSEWLGQHLGLALNPRVTQLFSTATGVPFLGWRVAASSIRARRSNRRRWVAGLRRVDAARLHGHLDADQAAARVQATLAHLATFESPARRRALARAAFGPPPEQGLYRLQPRQPRRLLEQHRVQPAGRQPQQELARQPQEQRRLPPVQLSARAPSSDVGWGDLPGLHGGADPALVPRVPMWQDLPVRDAEPRPPGHGGLHPGDVVAGHFACDEE